MVASTPSAPSPASPAPFEDSSGESGEDTSMHFRRKFGGLIWRAGIDLRMHTVTIATGALYFQRFFLAEGRDHFNATHVATSCLWLASKVSEDVRRLRDIANVFAALSGREEKMTELQMEEYWALRDEVVSHEQAVLRAMAFDAEPTPAYSFMTEFAWLLNCETGDRGVASLALTLLNDAFCTEVCALWPASRVALACVLLAVELGRRSSDKKLQVEAGRVAGNVDRLCREPELEDFLGISRRSGSDEIEGICRDLLALYEADHGARASASVSVEDCDL
eukprot:TRINITY_DN75235_c0_g1_i1.p1 TRINITY_DN75235_c0_g1~~TRINITY_DN75235_c0_g1_i1.p1  ORF type:complete len:304 (+),score=66.06 TRINITY_DN75235_c0_g1_i1:77-913(+)